MLMGEVTNSSPLGKAPTGEVQIGTVPGGPIRSFSLPPNAGQSPSSPWGMPELIAEEVRATELALPVDQMDGLRRRLLIAYHAFGAHAVTKIAAFLDLSTRQTNELLQEDEVQLAIRCNHVPSWTPAEIVAKLSVEADRAQKPQDRIAALRLLMEYRSMSAPEGGSRSFKRVAAKFTVSNKQNRSSPCDDRGAA